MSIVSSKQRSVGTKNEPIPHWQEAMKRAIRDPDELCRELGLPQPERLTSHDAAAAFRVFVPREFLSRMKRGDPDDPLLRQVLPVADELEPSAGFLQDPVSDQEAVLVPGLLQKYSQRVLLVTTGACAVHCRYCFRRHFPYEQTPPDAQVWNRAIARIATDTSIHEVLLSGGDPLTIRDELLADLARALAEIPHLHRLRLHTRLPIVIPQRVTDDLIQWLLGTRLVPWVVVHVNHPAELSHDVFQALHQFVDNGIPVLNQAVLLRGINDDLDTQVRLCEELVNARIVPYYLHQLDRVAGAAHFEVDRQRGQQLIEALRNRLPGYAVPRYVVELANAPSKQLLA